MNDGSVMIPEPLQAMRTAGLLRDLDVLLVESIVRTYGIHRASHGVWLALALTSRALDDGHVCLDLAAVSSDWMLRREPDAEPTSIPADVRTACENLADLVQNCHLDQLLTPITSIVGSGEARTPFVRQGARLYLRRYWAYEQTVAKRLCLMARDETLQSNLTPDMDTILENILPNRPDQQEAARLALTRRFTVITGGPGTGKTFVAARILALLTHLHAMGRGDALRIRLAAPTGKAAARLDESIRKARHELGQTIFRPEAALDPACTLEHLLGFQEGSPYFRHHAKNPLVADVVLVDEASMLDLAKMAKLLDALPPDTRLVLLGDHHQLASVQPGSVLTDICESPPLATCVATLTISKRFGADTPVGKLSAAVNTAQSPEDAVKAWHTLEASRAGSGRNGPQHTEDAKKAGRPSEEVEIRHHDTPSSLVHAGVAHRDFAEIILTGYKEFLHADTAKQAFDALKKFRVLCALRRGPLGVVRMNRAITDILSQRKDQTSSVAKNLLPEWKLNLSGEFYDHRVVMVTRNDYATGLFNGDIGVIMPDPEAGGQPVVFFEGTDPSAPGQSPFRKVSCGRLPEHETAFAMTIHKAQGSEFERVLVMLPPDKDNPVLTRELLYTAITRPSKTLEIWCNEDVFQAAVLRQTRRMSGLRGALVSGWRG